MGRERWGAIGLALLAIGYLLAGRRYPLDTLATPGPGIVPLASGLALLALAVWLFAVAGRVGATRISNRPPTERPGRADPATTSGLFETGAAPTRPIQWSALIMAGALVLYAALLPRLGFLASSWALVVVSSRLMGLEGWWRPAVLALGVTGVAYLLFARWLGVPLP
ncbi:MAG TPA: tripartite tricarboxylate transporter TctB family protein [Patescibacteria group bacterium]|nr:tripartite tricarboxylate transporter TctB family protein [Patescibacteria group bacterium]